MGLFLAITLFPLAAMAAQEQARKADDFVESIGVNVHLEYDTYVGGTRYQDIIKPRLGELGIRHMRTTILPGNQAYADRVNDLHTSFGIMATALAGPTTQTDAEFRDALNRVKHATIAAEGLNEPDGDWFWGWYGFTKDTWMPQTKAFQLRLFSFIKAEPDLSHLAVVGPSLMGPYRADWQLIANMEDRVDYGNFHLYQMDKPPGDAMDWWHVPNVRMSYPAKPLVCTEAGYASVFTKSYVGVGEYAQNRYVPRILLEHWRHGVTRTFLYELYDQGKSFDGKPEEKHFGLIKNEGAMKECALTIRNLIRILQEPKVPSFSPGSLKFALSGGDKSVHHFVLEKSDGTYFLVIWQDAKNVDYQTGQERIVVPEQNVNLVLNAAIVQASIYRPMTHGTDAVQTYANPTSIDLSVPDHPMIIAISPKQGAQ